MGTFVCTTWLATVLPVPADAFVRTLTCNEDEDPRFSPLGCFEDEVPLEIFWPTADVSYRINDRGSNAIEEEATLGAIRTSFETWSRVDCSYLTFHDAGFTSSNAIGYDQDNPDANENIVLFLPTYDTDGETVLRPWVHSPGILALTSVSYEFSTGRIVDADIEINEQYFTFHATDAASAVDHDLQNTLTHEVGHVVGLDENCALNTANNDPDACHHPDGTMFPNAPPGEQSKRDLAQDDIDGICTIYPIDGEIPEDGSTPAESCDCTMFSRGNAAPATALIWLFALYFVRRARPRPTGTAPGQSS